MVRAILAGRKTQTRRAIKAARPDWIRANPQPYPDDNGRLCYGWDGNVGGTLRCPYGQPGDRLWVRETFSHFERNDTLKPGNKIYYRADGECIEMRPYRPSIHMPRWASRITLEVSGVRVERLQDISEADALAEGVEAKWDPGYSGRLMEALGGFSFRPAASAYADLWELINGPDSWAINPWVWVVEFRRAGQQG